MTPPGSAAEFWPLFFDFAEKMAEQQVARQHTLYLCGKEHQEELAAELGLPGEFNKHQLLFGERGNGNFQLCDSIRHSSMEKHHELYSF